MTISHAARSDNNPIVFVVDDDVSVREALQSMICAAGWTPRTFASAQEFLAHPRALTPSCLVLNVTLPDSYGSDLHQMLGDRLSMPVIIITGQNDIAMTVRTMKAGAFEFLTKPFEEEAMLSAITSAIDLSQRSVRREAEIQALGRRYASLTLREREVMALAVEGRLNKLIGAALAISETTVKAHRGRVMRKMGANSLAHLVRISGELAVPIATRSTHANIQSPASPSFEVITPASARKVRLYPQTPIPFRSRTRSPSPPCLTRTLAPY